MAIGLGSSCSYGSVINLGLVAEYHFAGNLNDTSGNGYDLNAAGVFNYVTNQAGTPSGGVQLVAAASNGTFFLGNGPNLANQSSSVSFWVQKNYVGNGSNGSWVFGLGHPVGIGGTQGGDMHVALDYGDSVRYSFFYNDLSTYSALPNNAWVNITATFDYATYVRKIYIDGILDTSDTAQFAFSGGNSLKVGYAGISLSDLAFYNRTLSPSEVTALANPTGTVPDHANTAFLLIAAIAPLALILRRRQIP